MDGSRVDARSYMLSRSSDADLIAAKSEKNQICGMRAPERERGFVVVDVARVRGGFDSEMAAAVAQEYWGDSRCGGERTTICMSPWM